LDDVQEQILAAQDVMDRTEVRAPVRGIVVKLNQHTPGGVVGPGGVILELLPVNDELVLEARVKPTDITHVKVGQDALVRLSALNQRLTPMIQGSVTYVSADIVSDQGTPRGRDTDQANRESFIVRVRLDELDLKEKTENFRPTPGMPADIYIQTGQRTFFNYMGLRGIEWVILRLKTRQIWGFQGDDAFLCGLEFEPNAEWHEHRDADGGFGTHIRFLVFACKRQYGAFSVIPKHG
jgi:hypothetical protein